MPALGIGCPFKYNFFFCLLCPFKDDFGSEEDNDFEDEEEEEGGDSDYDSKKGKKGKRGNDKPSKRAPKRKLDGKSAWNERFWSIIADITGGELSVSYI